jgi:preprotein translocase subunit SecB
MSPDATTLQVQFEFVSLFVTKAIFEFLAGEGPQTSERPPIVSIGFEVGAEAQIANDGAGAFVKLETKIIPDQKWQPYRLEVSLGAAFRSQGSTVDELLTFCRVAAPSILFPYVREIVHRLTMDAPNGAVRLNPMNISQLLNQTEWTITQATSLTPADSTEPQQPSEQ